MKVKGLDRVIVMVRDLDLAMGFFAGLGIELTELEPSDFDRVAFSLEHQLELISPTLPLPPNAPPHTRRWAERLADSDCALVSLSFRVDSAEETAAGAQRAGIRLDAALNLAEIPPLPIFNFDELFAVEDDTLGLPVTFVSYQHKQGT